METKTLERTTELVAAVPVTNEQYTDACDQKEAAEKVIQQYHVEDAKRFEERLKSGVPFTDEELRYSATQLCPCGHGLAYPLNAPIYHYWDCSAILKGIADPNVQHEGQLPFAFYDVKGESEQRGTTRGVFRPKPVIVPAPASIAENAS